MTATTRLVITCALVTIVVLGAATASPWSFSPPQLPSPEIAVPSQNPLAVPSATPQRHEQPETLDPRWAVLVIVTLLVILIAALFTLAARRLLAIRREGMDTTPDNLTTGAAAGTNGDDVDLPEMQDAVTRALAHLDRHARPRDAVVAAWVALEEAAARTGTRRDPAQTTTEFAGTVLAATPAPPAAVTRLRTLYQRARFTDRPIDTTAVTQARRALADIARSLDVPDPERLIDTTGNPTGGEPA
jgi:hypothetical protein